jgi:hypothetical protein
MTTTVSKERMTRQGLRDLNSYGPRPVKSVEGAPPAATVADKETAPQAGPPASAAVDTHDDGGVTK